MFVGGEALLPVLPEWETKMRDLPDKNRPRQQAAAAHEQRPVSQPLDFADDDFLVGLLLDDELESEPEPGDFWLDEP